MRARDILMHRLFGVFERPVRLRANASPEELAARLLLLTRESFAWTRAERDKPLRGHIDRAGGMMRWPIGFTRIVSARELYVRFEQDSSGTVVAGSFKLGMVVRVYALIVLFGLSCAFLGMLGAYVYFHALPATIAKLCLNWLISLAMLYVYLAVVVLVGRGRDAALIHVLRTALVSEEGAVLVSNFLKPSRTWQHASFIDPTPEEEATQTRRSQ